MSAAPPPDAAISAGHGNDASNCDLDLRTVPVFTTEEERQEIESLSLADLVKVQSDLVGLTSLMESLQPPSGTVAAASSISASTATGNNNNSAMHATQHLEAELRRLPRADTEAYYTAIQRCPDQVSRERKALFLEANQNDVPVAAAKLAEYWRTRLEVFGNERAYLPMTLAGAMRDETMNLASRRVWQFLPQTDTAGRPVLFFCPGRRNFSEYSVEQELAAFWYFLETIIEDEGLRKKGFVLLADAHNLGWKHTNKKLTLFLTRAISFFMPLSVMGVHICYPSAHTNYVILVLKRLMPKSFRLRTKVHYGTRSQVLTELSGFRLPMDRVPVDMGGLSPVNAAEWVMKRQVLEMLRAQNSVNAAASAPLAPVLGELAHQQNWPPLSAATTALLSEALATLQQQINPSLAAVAPTVQQQQQQQQSQHTPPTDGAAPTRGIDGATQNDTEVDGFHFPSHSDRQLYEWITQERQTNLTGRKSDPRMHRALVLTLENPSLSKLDALLAGGFVFSGKTRSELTAVCPKTQKDSEGVSLKQRRDQFNRRLREINGWIDHARDTGDVLGSKR